MSLLNFKGRFINPKDGSIHEGYLIAEGGRVKELAARKAAAGEVVQLNGYTVPGLIDAHLHLCLDGGPDPIGNFLKEPYTIMVVRAIGLMKQHLQAGVTTVRDLGGPKGLAIHLRDAVNQGLVQGPRIWACGHNITISGGHGWQFGVEADGPDGVRKAARTELKAGADGLKFMATGGIITQGVLAGAEAMTVEEMRAGALEAHKVGKRTAAHAQGLVGVKNALKAGIDTIEHGPFDRWDQEGLSLMLAQKAVMLPTLAPRELVLGKKALARKILPKWLIDKAEAATKDQPGNVVQAYQAGVKIVASTDAGVPMMPHGLLHVELKVYDELGFSKLNILRSATLYGAEALGWNDIGLLEPGCWADMAVLRSNPLEDVRAYAEVVGVVKGGQVLA
jgi:imidazolonepropionase-like amidohydrolase